MKTTPSSSVGFDVGLRDTGAILRSIERDRDPFEQRSLALQAAAWQDALLQSYRTIHITLQGLLLAAGAAAGIESLTNVASNNWRGQFAFAFIVLLALLHVYAAIVLRRVIAARAHDVNWWHKLILRIEQRIPSDGRYFTKFKIDQRLHRDEKPDLAQLFLGGEMRELSDEECGRLVDDRGKVRSALDGHLNRFIHVVWAALLVIGTIHALN